MCLIIHNPLCREVSDEIIDNAIYQNQDGFGIFYHDTGEIVRTMSEQRVWDIMTNINRGYTCHFRYSTSGKVGKKQCHPFHIDETYSLMMNGTIERLVSSKSVDTQELCKILKGLDEERILSILRTYPCRFSLLNRKSGQAIMVNRDLWVEHKGVHFSKGNALPQPSKVVRGFSSYIPAKVSPKPTTVNPWRSYSPTTKHDWSGVDELTESWNDPWGNGNTDPFDGSGIPLDYDSEWDDYYARMEEEYVNEIPTGNSHVVAVYGTLKSGHGNHDRLMNKAKFLGTGETFTKYPMVVSGIPYLIDRAGKGHHVKVEVYRVTTKELRDLDGLEGHPDWYVRTALTIKMDKGSTLTAWVYMIPDERSHTHMDDTGVYQNEF
jgi:gamma-glutamylaminecyclotransferase